MEINITTIQNQTTDISWQSSWRLLVLFSHEPSFIHSKCKKIWITYKKHMAETHTMCYLLCMDGFMWEPHDN